jgi:uncharacterized cupredoxin-like copper-binding protein
MRMRTYRTAILLATAASLTLLVSACTSASANGASSASSAVPSASVPTDQATVNATLSDFAINLDNTSVPAGEVIFQITNSGPSGHEMVVLKTDQQAASFPVTGFEGDQNRFNEDADGLKNVGETGDMPVAAGATDTLTLHLKPGHYAIVCNLPGHYMAGMHQDFTVTG